MIQEWDSIPAPKARTRRDAELFIHLRLETAGTAPLLEAEEVAQAARTALAARVRQHRCRVLAVGSGADHLHAVLQFPPSLSLRHLVQVAWEASELAVAQALSARDGRHISSSGVWGGQYQLDTLSQADVADVIAYVERHPDVPTEPGLERAEVWEKTGRRPVWPYFMHESYGYYRQSTDTPPS